METKEISEEKYERLIKIFSAKYGEPIVGYTNRIGETIANYAFQDKILLQYVIVTDRKYQVNTKLITYYSLHYPPKPNGMDSKKQQIDVVAREIYGKVLTYPICEKAKLLAKLTSKITFTADNITVLQELGYALNYVTIKR